MLSTFGTVSRDQTTLMSWPPLFPLRRACYESLHLDAVMSGKHDVVALSQRGERPDKESRATEFAVSAVRLASLQASTVARAPSSQA